MTDQTLPIYLLPGMTPQYPVYTKLLPLLPNAQVVPFIAPKPNEPLTSYAERMAPKFQKPCFIAGVSFGGILAQEISRVIHTAGCIVVASVQNPSQLPPWVRCCRPIGGRRFAKLVDTLGSLAKLVPERVHTKSTARLINISGTLGEWHRWAVSAVLDWAPSAPVDIPLVHIHGDADTTFPIRYTDPHTVIRHGRHALPISHPSETAAAILDFTRTI